MLTKKSFLAIGVVATALLSAIPAPAMAASQEVIVESEVKKIDPWERWYVPALFARLGQR